MKRDMILKPWEVTRALEELFLRPAVKAVRDARGNVKFVERDSDSEWLTITDVAAVLQKPVSAVREMCKSRAQKGLHALPFIRINGKGVRFNRAKITDWLEGMPDNHSRPRRTVTQEKKAHPERFCAAAKCLWRVTDRNGTPLKPCPKHPAKLVGDDTRETMPATKTPVRSLGRRRCAGATTMGSRFALS